jgi:hypothetical protein
MSHTDGAGIRSALVDLFAAPFDAPPDDDAFDAVAHRIFAWQYAHNAPYTAFCDRRGRTPATVRHWAEIPAVPTAAFKEVALVAGDVATAEAQFRTSGTTRGAEKRGTHHVLDVSLYHQSLLSSFQACLLADGAVPLILSLMPPAAALPDSSLAHMIDTVMQRMGAPGSTHCASVDGGIDHERLKQLLSDAESAGTIVCLLGTSLAFVHWLDHLALTGERFRLPPGSRLMDTGGYKGHGRRVEEDALRELYDQLLGVPASHCINEYGMTEMLSQFYDSTFRDATLGRSNERRKCVPPWVRTRIVDAERLEPVPPGEPGLLQHFDAANVHSVMAIQTEDIAIAVDDGFRLLGRATGATPRGCSIAMDLLLDAVRERGS